MKSYALILFILIANLLSGQIFTRIYEGEIVSDEDNSFCSAWADFDNDGDLDLFVANIGDNNCLYLNNADGTFDKMLTGEIVNNGGTSLTSYWIDYDNDGLLDMFITNDWTAVSFLFKNTGGGMFERILDSAVSAGDYYYHSEWADYDKNGFIDVYLSSFEHSSQNKLYDNLGDGSFQISDNYNTQFGNSHSFYSSWIDLDYDNDLDLLTINSMNVDNYVFKNNDGNLTRDYNILVGNDEGNSHSIGWADFNNDLKFDAFVANTGFQNNYLYVQNEDNSFSAVTTGDVPADFGNSRSACWGDYDNDGDTDLFVANGEMLDDYQNFLYENIGDNALTAVTDGPIVNDNTNTMSANWIDYDDDGDLDLFIANGTGDVESKNCLYRNDGNKNHWLKIKLSGTQSDSYALGAVLKVKAMIDDVPVRQMRRVSSSTGRASQCGYYTHFGMGNATCVDSLVIEWPSGNTERFSDVAVNQTLYITEESTHSEDALLTPAVSSLANYPNPFNPVTAICFYLSRIDTKNAKVEIYNTKGQRVETLPVICSEGEGTTTWNAAGFASGIYFYKLNISGSPTRKMVLMK